MPDEAPAPQVPHQAPRRFPWRWILLLIIGAAVWIGFVSGNEKKKPSLTLSDGVQLIYEGSSRGVLQAAAAGAKDLPAYKHAPPPQGQQLKRLWQKARGALPGWIVSRLPAWDLHPERFPGWDHPHECELRFRVWGPLTLNHWDISIADDRGWENPVHYYIYDDDGLAKGGFTSLTSGWLRLGSPYPRHAEMLRVRFRPTLTARSLTPPRRIGLPQPRSCCCPIPSMKMRSLRPRLASRCR